MSSPPNSFSNQLEVWIYKKHISSVVSVEFRPDSMKVLERWNYVAPLAEGSPEEQKRFDACQVSAYSTGSVIGEDNEGRMLILTCAHVLGPAFSSGNPITAEEIEQLYQPFVMCDHRESRFQRHEDANRVPTYATVAEISCTNDLLLLKVMSFALLCVSLITRDECLLLMDRYVVFSADT